MEYIAIVFLLSYLIFLYCYLDTVQLFPDIGHTWQISGIISVSALMNNSWWEPYGIQESKTNTLPTILPLWSQVLKNRRLNIKLD